ncbi:MAG: hypothetical protein AAF870_07565 [Pseudomonadota bacterium]
MSKTILATCMVAIAGLAHAQNGPVGIAFVQAPEQGGGVAIASTPEVAFANATAQCMQSGALEEDCIKTNWCMPAGWSVDVFVQHQEGPHWHEVVCGLPTKSAAMAAVLHMCDPAQRDYLLSCFAVQVYDTAGKPQMPN